MSSSGIKKDDFDTKLEQMMNRVKQIQTQSPLHQTVSDSALSKPPQTKRGHASTPASHAITSLLGPPPPSADAGRRQSSNSITIGGRTISGIPRALSAKIRSYQADEQSRDELRSRARGLKKAKEEHEAELRRIKREAAIDFTTLNRKVLNQRGAEESLQMAFRTIHRTSGGGYLEEEEGVGWEDSYSIGPPTLTSLSGYTMVDIKPDPPSPFASPASIPQRTVRKSTLDGPAFASAVGLPLSPSPTSRPPLPPPSQPRAQRQATISRPNTAPMNQSTPSHHQPTTPSHHHPAAQSRFQGLNTTDPIPMDPMDKREGPPQPSSHSLVTFHASSSQAQELGRRTSHLIPSTSLKSHVSLSGLSFIGASDGSIGLMARSLMSANGGAAGGVGPGLQNGSSDFMAPENRAIRVLLTSRPATGGSPTMMEPFLSEHRLLSSVRSERGEEVRLRHLEVEAEEQRKREWEAGRRARAAEEEARRQSEVESRREREARFVGWSGICHWMGRSIAFLVSELEADRRARPVRAQRKAAALLIEKWYKSILIRRKQRSLVLLIRRIKKAIRPSVPKIKERCRETCALRVVGFLQAIDGAQRSQATVLVARFMASIHRLQDWWRTMILVRETQYTLLTNHLIAYEKALIRHSKGEKKNQSNSSPQLSRGVQILNNTAMATGRSLFTTAAAFAGGFHPQPSNHHIEIEDPALERLLTKHTELLPHDLRHRLVTRALAEERRAFSRRTDKYRVDIQSYAAQLHVEELRLKLMREAGLDATPLLRKPVKPVMLALLPRGRLKMLLGEGVQEILKYKRDVEQVEIMAAASRALGRTVQLVESSSRPSSPIMGARGR